MTDRENLKCDIYGLADPDLMPVNILSSLLEDPTLTIAELLFIQKKCTECRIEDLLVVLNRQYMLETEDEEKQSSYAAPVVEKKLAEIPISFEEFTRIHPLLHTVYAPRHVSTGLDLHKQAENAVPNSVSPQNKAVLERIVGMPLFRHTPFEKFKNTFYFDKEKGVLNRLGRKYRSWSLNKKNDFCNSCLEPRVKTYLYESFQNVVKRHIIFSDMGPYRYDRLSKEALQYQKERGTIHPDFEYDHPYWFSREPLNFFLIQMQKKELTKYTTWEKKITSSNKYDREPRIWDGEIIRRLLPYEMLQAKANGEIHTQFEYDNMYWMENWSYTV